MIKTILSVVTGCLATSLFAAEYFAATNGNDVWDGLYPIHIENTDHGPKTLQGAIDQADGTTPTLVTVLPGVYEQGEFTTGDHHARIGITKGNLVLRSSGGKVVTHIVGRRATTFNGIGSGALRCIYVGDREGADYTVTQSTNVVIEGFTIRDGATRATSGATGQGGGVYNPNKGEMFGGAMLVDCVVSNCAAGQGGGVSRIAAYRTLFTGNFATDGAAGNFAQFASCVFVGNKGTTSVIRQFNNAFGCTFAVNDLRVLENGYGTSSALYNCLAFANSGGNGGASNKTNLKLVGSVAADPAFYTSVDSMSIADAGSFQCVSTALGDWRVLSTAEAATKVTAANYTKFTLPPGYEYADYDGNPIDTAGQVYPGAVQSAAVSPAGGRIDFSADFEVLGSGLARAGTYLVPTAWPTTYRIRPVTGEMPCFSITVAGDCVESTKNPFLRPLYDGWARVVPPRTVEDSYALGVRKTSALVYVDAMKGNDDWDGTCSNRVGTTSQGPKKTIQAAVNAAKDDSLIYVAPGVYDEGGFGADMEGTIVSNRVYASRPLGFVAWCGPGTATVKGAANSDSEPFGPSAMRCFHLGRSSFVQGFVLTGGHSGDSVRYFHKGSAAYCDAGALLADCIVSNNHARSCAALYNGRAVRTRFYDNQSDGNPVMEYVQLGSCVVSGNDAGSATPAQPQIGKNSELYGCTVDANGAYGYLESGPVYGSILVRSSKPNKDPSSFANLECQDAWFADRDGYDYRLGVWSEALGYVSCDDYARSNMFFHIVTDVNGGDLQWKDGRMTAGAVHADPPMPMYAVTATGGGVEVEGGSEGTNVVLVPVVVTVRATNATTRPFVGFRVNGVIRQPVSTTFSFAVSTAGESADVCAVYGTNWYVAVTGSDANSGGTPDTAKRTIPAAARLAVRGDVIHVAAGTYTATDGTMIHTKKVDSGDAPITVASCVVLPEGVGLVADEGANLTSIVGASAPEGDANGLGAGAVRCLMLETDSWVRGFTLTGGHTAAGTQSCDDNDAGAVLGRRTGACHVYDCLVVDNVAARSGAGFKCTFHNCRILRNKATSRASVGRESGYYQCFIDGNVGDYVTEYHSRIDSCTFGAGNVKIDGTQACQARVDDGSESGAVNTLFAGGTVVYLMNNVHNCVFPDNCGITDRSHMTDCIFTNAEALVLDGTGRPVVDRCAAIDRADAARSAVETQEKDLSGFQRVMNGVRDIGALEADWRPAYRKALGRKVSVMSASPEVRMDETQTVRIPTGALDCTLTADGDYKISFGVSGTGTLSITADGAEPTTYGAGDHVLELSGVAAGTALKFFYTPGDFDSGCAEVRRIVRQFGLILIVR